MIEPKVKEHYKALIKKQNPRQEIFDVLEMFIDKYDGSSDDQFHSIMLVLVSLLSEIEDLKIVKKGFDEIAELSKNTSGEVNSILSRFRDLQAGKEPQLPYTSATSKD